MGAAAVERWAGLHRLSGILMIGLMVQHLLLHRTWLVGVVRKFRTAEAL